MGATFADQQTFIREFYHSAFTITDTKGQDYTPDGISLLELLPTCVEADLSPPQALWALYRKHFSAIRKHFFYDQALITEPILDRLMDAANYFALMAWYDVHKADIHRAWWSHWSGQQCEPECIRVMKQPEFDYCQRCETLSWMERRGLVPS